MKTNAIGLQVIDALELQEKMDNYSNFIVIDVRRVDEWNYYGIIEGSKLIEFFDNTGNYNLEKWLNDFSQYVKTKDTPFVIYCAHANRTKIIGNYLANELGYQNVYELEGGINYGWLDKGFKTVKHK